MSLPITLISPETASLVKPYATPYKEMADVIRDGSRGGTALVALDMYGALPDPVLSRLGNSIQVNFMKDEASASQSIGGCPKWTLTRVCDKHEPRGSTPRIRKVQSAGTLGSKITARPWTTRILLQPVRVPIA